MCPIICQVPAPTEKARRPSTTPRPVPNEKRDERSPAVTVPRAVLPESAKLNFGRLAAQRPKPARRRPEHETARSHLRPHLGGPRRTEPHLASSQFPGLPRRPNPPAAARAPSPQTPHIRLFDQPKYVPSPFLSVLLLPPLALPRPSLREAPSKSTRSWIYEQQARAPHPRTRTNKKTRRDDTSATNRPSLRCPPRLPSRITGVGTG